MNTNKKSRIYTIFIILVIFLITFTYLHADETDLQIFKSEQGYGIKNKKTGRVVAEPKYTEIKNYVLGYAVFHINNKYGFLDSSGREIVPAQYDMLNIWNIEEERLVVVKLNEKFGALNINGKKVIEIKYDSINPLTSRSYIAGTGKKFGLIDINGKGLCPFKYDALLRTYYGDEPIAEVYINKKIGLLEASGKEIIPVQYDEIMPRKS